LEVGRSSGEGDKTRPQLKISMKVTKLLLAIALFSPTTWSQSKPETAVAGAWEGTSLCTVPNSPCHDEHVVLHIKADLKDSSKFSIDADKIVNGEEEFMGTLSCVYTAAKSELYCDNPGDWRFTITGDKMVGTLTLKNGTLYRKIDVQKK
jgi:hypothetical protein